MPLSLDNTVERKPLLDLSQTSVDNHSPEFKQAEAAKLHVSLGGDSPGLMRLQQDVDVNGGEQYKKQLSDREQLQKVQTQNDIIDSILTADPKSITPEMIDVIQGLDQSQLSSPDLSDIVEKEYAKKFTTTAATTMGNGIFDDSMDENPEGTHEVLDRLENHTYKANYISKILDEANRSVEDQSWLGAAYNLGENILIGNYQTYNQAGSAGADETQELSALPGKNRIEGYAFLWGLDDKSEFKGYIDRIKDDLSSRNPYAFQEWFTGLMTFGNSDAAWNTAMTGLDVASVIPVGAIGKFGKAAGRLAKVAARNPEKLEEIAGAVGKNLDSGVGGVVRDVQDGSFLNGIRKAKDVEKSIPHFQRPDEVMTGGTLMPNAAYNRMAETLRRSDDLQEKFFKTNQVERLTTDEVADLKDELSARYLKDNPVVAKNVIDVQTPIEPDVGGSYTARVIIGQRDGSLFESEKQARNYFNRYLKLKTDDYQIVQHGEGFQIEVNKLLDESKLGRFDLQTSQQTPHAWGNLIDFVAKARSPIEQLSDQQKIARSTLTTHKEQLDDLFREMAQPLAKLNKKELTELNDLFTINQTSKQYYDNVGEFEQAFFNRFKKAPTEGQVEGYFTYTKILDTDLIIRDVSVYSQKASKGLEEFTVPVKDGKQVFEGKILDRLPFEADQNFRVGVIENGKLRTTYSPYLKREKIDDLLSKGYKIVRPFDSDFKIGKQYLDYVVTKDLKRNRIGLQNINRNPGGHQIVDARGYIKQGKISGETDGGFYRGDQTLWAVSSEAEGKELTKILEQVRQMVLNHDAGLMKFIRDNLPIPTREFARKLADGTIDPNVPFAFTHSGQRTIDTAAYKSMSLKDVTTSVHRPDNITGRFLGKRGEGPVDIIKSEGNATWRIEPAPYLSPLEALKSSTADMISLRAFDNYKIMTLNNFIREFSDVLEGSLSELKLGGYETLMNPKFQKTLEGSVEQAAKIAKAKNVSRAFNQLMDHSTTVSRKIDLYKMKLLEPLVSKLGLQDTKFANEHLLGHTKDPASWMKGLAFHTKMGFWNPTQYFKQANAVVQVVSIGGVNGLRGAAMYPLLRGSLMTNDAAKIARLGKVAERTGLARQKDFEDIVALYKKSGYNHIGNDTAYLDSLKSPDLLPSKPRKALSGLAEASATPFYEGERLSRLAAFATSYLDHKALKGTAKLTSQDEARILYRSKTLIGNMTREANAPWQKGYLSVVTQFFGFQARIMDQFLGKQLTATEKARLFVGYSMMYGVPVAAAGGIGVLPVRDIVVNELLKNGVDTESPAVKPFIDGMVSTMSAFMFGKDWNIASSYGPGGLPTFYDMFRGDKTFSDLLLGASGGIGLDIAWPALKAIWSETEDLDGGLYNTTADDMLKSLRQISSFDSLYKIYQVYNTGIWMSKNGYDIAKMDLPDAVFAALTGLSPAHVEQAFAKKTAAKDLKTERKNHMYELIRRLKEARRMDSSPEREMIIRGIKAEIQMGGFDARERSQISRYAWDKDTLEDRSLDQYDEELKRLNQKKQKQNQNQE